MFAIVVPLLVYWLVFFVACYVVTEKGHDQLYDEVTPHVGLKVAAASLLMALLATWLRPSYETMFTADLPWTVLQGIVWVGAFMLILQFHPSHALGLGLLTLALVAGLATLGIDSLTKPTPTLAPVQAKGALPLRKSLSPGAGSVPATVPKVEAAKAEAPKAEPPKAETPPAK